MFYNGVGCNKLKKDAKGMFGMGLLQAQNQSQHNFHIYEYMHGTFIPG